jgi:hypothetical protein
MKPEPLSERGAAWWREYLHLGPDDPIPPGCAEPIIDENDLILDVDLDGEDEDDDGTT